jgi:hypothetical protein
MPSQRIFFERHRSQACAMRDWQVDPTLITFMGSIPGMLAMWFVLRRYRLAVLFRWV